MTVSPNQIIIIIIIQLLNDFSVYIEKYFAKICNINRVAVGREVDIANLSKIFFNVY